MGAAEKVVEDARQNVAQTLMRLNNSDYSLGLSRDHYSEPPIWMERKADHVVEALEEGGLLAGADAPHVDVERLRALGAKCETFFERWTCLDENSGRSLDDDRGTAYEACLPCQIRAAIGEGPQR